MKLTIAEQCIFDSKFDYLGYLTADDKGFSVKQNS